MCVNESYVDDIFKNHPYKEKIKKYVYGESDSIDFDPNEITNSISNNRGIYSKLLDIYSQNQNDSSIIKLFKVISLHNIENIYIFEMIIINIVSGLSVKDALFKCISTEKIINWEREYKKHSSYINPISNEIINAKFHTIIYYYYAMKYFPKETEEYIESIYSSNKDEIISEYKDNILIALIAITVKIYYGDSSKIDILLEYSKEVNYLDAILSLLLLIGVDENIMKRFVELFDTHLLNDNRELIINLAYLMRIFFLLHKNIHEKLKDKSLNEFLIHLKSMNIPVYFLFLIKYLDHNILTNINAILDKTKDFYKNDKDDFYKLIYILKHVNIPCMIEIKIALTCVLLNMKDENADISILNDNIDYLINNFKSNLESVYNKKSNDIFELLESIDKYDLSINMTNEIIFTVKIIVIMYEYNEKAKKITDALLKYMPYNLAIPIIIREKKYFYNIRLKDILEYLQGYDLDLKDLIITYIYSYPIYTISPKYMLKIINNNTASLINIFNDKVFLKAISYKSYGLIDFIELLYKKDRMALTDYSVLCYILNLKNKDVIKCALGLIEKDENNSRAYIENSIHEYREDIQFHLKRIIKKWNYSRKEFNFNTLEEINQYIDNYYEESQEDLISFIDEAIISNVFMKKEHSVQVPVKVIKYILIEYMLLEEPYKIKDIHKMIELFDIDSLTNTFENIYKDWIENGSDESKKNIILPYCIYAHSHQIMNLYNQIEYWDKNFKSSLASYIMPAIAMNGDKLALMVINNIISVSENKKLKKAAIESFKKASECLDIPVDNLFDKIIPNLGLNIERNKTVSYGPRTFTLQLLSDSYLQVIDDENHKIIKELPEPEESDDIKMAEEAIKEFEDTKNALVAIINYQTQKLKKVLFNGRKWDYQTFFEVFVENSVMHYLTASFIWGVYDELGNLIDCFRFMEDGSLSSQDEDLYELPKEINGKNYITLFHPVEHDEEYTEIWASQLELYEINQPIEQLKLQRYILDESFIENNSIIVFNGTKLYKEYMEELSKELDIKVERFNGHISYYLLDDVLKTVCEINCDVYNDEMIINNIKFYVLESYNIFRKVINPMEVSPRFVSTILHYLSFGFCD